MSSAQSESMASRVRGRVLLEQNVAPTAETICAVQALLNYVTAACLVSHHGPSLVLLLFIQFAFEQAVIPGMPAMLSPDNSTLFQLRELLGPDFASQLAALVNRVGVTQAAVRVEAHVCSTGGNQAGSVVGYLDLQSARQGNPTPISSPGAQLSPRIHHLPSPVEPTSALLATQSQNEACAPETAITSGYHPSAASKRRKVVGGSRPCTTRERPISTAVEREHCDDDESSAGVNLEQEQPLKARSIRQVHTTTRFPQRTARKEQSVPIMTSTSTEKLVCSIWRQIHSEIRWDMTATSLGPNMYIHGAMSKEAFRVVNSLCFTYHSRSQTYRALEMIVQAYWVDCYEARITAISLDQPTLTATEARMSALREACSVQKLTEKDLRNRLAIWRGYKEIKDAGGWASLLFAGVGVYRFCKYRIGFNEGLLQRLRQLRHSFEVAADTLRPEWRDLLGAVGQKSPREYDGHPHEWVTIDGRPACPLRSTYAFLGKELVFEFVDDCVIDRATFGAGDPRRILQAEPDMCAQCQQKQSDDVQLNRCSCFPNLFGCVRLPPPVQIFRTGNAKNNGVVARLDFERGAAVGEFVGLVTAGIDGVDVMVGEASGQSYQIFQGQMGNFTRFINHSCHPNAQFQRFCWMGTERILVVSRGITAGSEITVDYSDEYWKNLDKECLCGEPSCRYPDRSHSPRQRSKS
ncbi:hypothetical protein ASPCAL11257 [Aspergillus calidoustus]|uniref:SET domain-containing protein n=1 Tax=Aspergillus calidoustus TaxID=454130 RepID=A0A0U5GC68_ASPCI|nr:hypothetical protein ASPCAL11257 [Aspergillus calidoustus]